MKKTLSISLLMLGAGLLYSCGKARIDTPYTKIEGNWAVIQTATDDNGNGKLDDNEIRTATDNETFQFLADSTGTLHIAQGDTTTNIAFKWAFISNYTQLRRVVYTDDTVVSQIEALTAGDMTLMNFTSPQLSWYILRKR